ncbi:Lipoyl synthase, mitochondrial [Thelohanellus kitauei]|uniref:Lipoyl synthase, mitochondrial n=1 Tax=Thelohanellus kitauei TaxID=669202 RepID=A0A0C2NAM3_THEKT|nr:Lipoyl synthase, mitochondrial [Thelohanellus kitauei]
MHVLKHAKVVKPELLTKSSIMVGFGETFDEVIEAMKDLREIQVDCLAIGQYMQPTKMNAKVEEYILPETFEKYKEIGMELGFMYVASGPLVRTSYKAGEYYLKNYLKK